MHDVTIPGAPGVEPPIRCAGTGQDGEHQMGVAWPSPRFTDLGDGTVRDNMTRLIWLQDADCKGTTFPKAGGKASMVEAYVYVNTLNEGNIPNDCGDDSSHTDWRIPNRFELESLLDLGEVGPPLPAGHPFTNVQLDYYWSSSYESYYAPELGIGWAVHFSAGAVAGRSWTLEPSYLWPVRGGYNN